MTKREFIERPKQLERSELAEGKELIRLWGSLHGGRDVQKSLSGFINPHPEIGTVPGIVTECYDAFNAAAQSQTQSDNSPVVKPWGESLDFPESKKKAAVLLAFLEHLEREGGRDIEKGYGFSIDALKRGEIAFEEPNK